MDIYTEIASRTTPFFTSGFIYFLAGSKLLMENVECHVSFSVTENTMVAFSRMC